MPQKSLNPFEFSPLKHHAIPFDQVQADQYLPSLKKSLERARSNFQTIKSQKGGGTFENTIVALETMSEDADLISSLFYNQLNANTKPELQALAQEIGPLLSHFSSDVLLDEDIFQRIQSVYQKRDSLKLTPEQMQLLDKTYSDFRRNGALLNEEQKKTLRELDAELSKLGPQYSDNVLKATNDFTLHVTNQNELSGLPDMVKEAAAAAAKEKNMDGWLFTLQMPSYIPFMQFAEHRPAREKMYRAYAGRCFGGDHDNQGVVLKILQLREKRAQLLGYKNHAEFILEKRMAEKPENVFRFLERLEKVSLQAAHKDVSDVAEYAKSKGAPAPLMPWDFTFWSERMKEERYQLNQEELRPYFKLENVIQGAFEHARKLYGITFQPAKDYPVYHPDVQAYEVHTEKSKKYVGLFYVDVFPRESKNGGAWMTSYYDQGLFNGQVHRPHIAIVCNFTQPTASKPSLLTFDEVNTLFHEFGHALHGMLSQCTYRSLSGTNVYWDFVELPSQIMENWILEKDSLNLFARHYETGEAIPAHYVEKIKKSRRYLAGYSCARQLLYAHLDMIWHTTDTKKIQNVAEFEDAAVKHLRVLPKIEGTNLSCSFAHIFAGGYSAGYYSYKWAEVLDADAFEFFKEKGIFNPEVSSSFKDNILERGGSEPPMTLYKRFRGREPDPDALLRRDGLI